MSLQDGNHVTTAIQHILTTFGHDLLQYQV